MHTDRCGESTHARVSSCVSHQTIIPHSSVVFVLTLTILVAAYYALFAVTMVGAAYGSYDLVFVRIIIIIPRCLGSDVHSLLIGKAGDGRVNSSIREEIYSRSVIRWTFCIECNTAWATFVRMEFSTQVRQPVHVMIATKPYGWPTHSQLF